MLGASPPPPTMTTTPQGAEASRAAPGDRDRLKAELDELRKVVDSLQLQKLSKHPHPDSPSKLSAVSFAAAAAAAAVTIAASSWAYKKGLWIRRDKVRGLSLSPLASYQHLATSPKKDNLNPPPPCLSVSAWRFFFDDDNHQRFRIEVSFGGMNGPPTTWSSCSTSSPESESKMAFIPGYLTILNM
jgi:hypothetical protein